MEIGDIRVRCIEKDDKLKAIVSFTIDGAFTVHDVKVIKGERGLFIAMPSKKGSDGEFRDICHPITSEARNKLQDLVLEAYQKEIVK